MGATVRVAAVAVLVAMAGGGLGACTVAELRRDIDRTQARIDDKQQALAADEARRDALEQQRRGFVADLEARRMSLDEMNRRLAQLQADNRRIAATTAQQQAQQRRLDEQLAQQRAEIARLQAEGGGTDDDKRRRLERLRQELRRQLELQLH